MKMKNYITISSILLLFLVTGFTSEYGNQTSGTFPTESVSKTGNNISKLINGRKSRAFFTELSFLSKSNKHNLDRLDEFVSKAEIFDINFTQLRNTYNNSPKDIILRINAEGIADFELELTQVNIAPADLKLQIINSNSKNEVPFKQGLAYWGIIKGDNNSIASITIFEDCIMGLISNDNGNFVLGAKKDASGRITDDYIFYNDKDLVIKDNFKCDVDDYAPIHQKGLSLKKSIIHNNSSMPRATSDSIRVYFTADYQMYLDNGSNVQQTSNFIFGAFSNTALIYANESIPVRLSQTISVYTSLDPYSVLNNSYAILNLFGANTQDNFTGDLAHLLSTGHNQQLGGIAWINILCQPYFYYPPPDDAHYGRYAFSNIEPNFLPYPLYSWTVTVITHEMGHNIASKHTHACVWPTSSGVVDSCYASEGNCISVTAPNPNGTIMSYCHLINGGAINLSRGFGPLPGDTIRLGYEYAECIDSALNSSELPLTFDLMQNYPNPFNPGTYIKYALPQEGYVTIRIYDLRGREVTTLIKNKFYEAGIFSSYFNAGDFNLASGVYFYRLDVIKGDNTSYSQIKKMVLIK